MDPGTEAWQELERRARADADRRTFEADDTTALPPAAARYLDAAIAPGTALAPAARLEMRGRIKIGRWLPFRARQLLAPSHGTVWIATVGGIIRGNDRYVAGAGGMVWKLLGLVPLVRAEGSDVSRSAAERAAGESIWVPTALVAHRGVTWSASTDDQVDVRLDVDGHPVTLHQTLDADGRLRQSHFLRWGDPDRTGAWAEHPFGVEITGHRTFDGLTVPNTGRAGWHFGTDRWDAGVFFEFEITGYELLTSP